MNVHAHWSNSSAYIFINAHTGGTPYSLGSSFNLHTPLSLSVVFLSVTKILVFALNFNIRGFYSLSSIRNWTVLAGLRLWLKVFHLRDHSDFLRDDLRIFTNSSSFSDFTLEYLGEPVFEQTGVQRRVQSHC